MAILNQLLEKCAAGAGFIVSYARLGWEYVKSGHERRKLSGEIRALYEKLGRTIYESKGEDMDTCRAICETIDEKTVLLNDRTAREAAIRKRNRCPSCGAYMGKKARFCSSCGAAMPEKNSEE